MSKNKRVLIIEIAILAVVVLLCVLAACNAFGGADPIFVQAMKGWLPIVAGIVLIVSSKFGGYFFLKGLDSAVDDDHNAKPRLLGGVLLIAVGLLLSGAIHSFSQSLTVSSEKLWRAYLDQGNKKSDSAFEQSPLPGKEFVAADAEKMYKDALKLAEAFGEKDPRLIISLNNLGLFYHRQKKYDLAEPLLKRIVVLHAKYKSGESGTVGLAQEQLAFLYRTQGKNDLAAEQYRAALALYENELLHSHTQFVAQQAQTIMNNLSEINMISDAEVVAKYEHFINEVEQFSPDETVWFIEPLATWKSDHKSPDEAEALYLREIAILEKRANPKDRFNHYTILLANALDGRACILERERNQKKEALHLNLRAFKLRNSPNTPIPKGFLEQLQACKD